MSLLRLLRFSSPSSLVRCVGRHRLLSQPVQEATAARAPTSDAADPKLAYYFYTLSEQVRQQMNSTDPQAVLDNYIRRNRVNIVDGLRQSYDDIVKFVNDSMTMPPSAIVDGEIVLYTSHIDPRIDKNNSEARLMIRKELMTFVKGELGFRDARIVPSCLWYEVRIPLDPKYSAGTAQIFRALAQKGFDAIGQARRQ